MNFTETEKYLLSLGNEVSAMKLGLENIRKLLAALGDPHAKYLKVQIAGTNGKGSVCAFLNSICLAAGINVGMYTSPHLVSITERVQVDGKPITEDEFARLATRVREISEGLARDGAIDNVPTFFEQVTAIALLAFASANVELAILETGLGGRLDATTAANAEIAAITRIDYDHQNYLGETIEEIAAEKAAIIRERSQVVVGEQKPEAMNVILDRCHEFGIEPQLASRIGIPPVELGLVGSHQRENARVAILLAETVGKYFKIRPEQIAAGLATARHPGRLEWIGHYLLDGAHNVGGAQALRTYLEEFVKRPITMIFGAMSDKDVSEIASVLFPKANKLILTKPNNLRAADPLRIAEAFFGGGEVTIEPEVRSALTAARDRSAVDDVILVTGSLYLVGEARAAIFGQTKN